MIERSSGLVDQDRVDLVDDRERVPPLDAIFGPPGHVVAQVVEAELVVRSVGDVCVVHRLAFFGLHSRLDCPDRQAEEAVDRPHPLRVASRQVVVDRDDVYALAGERVEVDGRGRDERLALAGLHLGDEAVVEGDAADKLDVEVPLAEGAPGGLAHDGEGLGKQVVEGLAFGQTLLELLGHAPELFVRELLYLGLELAGGLRLSDELLQTLAFTETQDLVEHRRPLSPEARADARPRSQARNGARTPSRRPGSDQGDAAT